MNEFEQNKETARYTLSFPYKRQAHIRFSQIRAERANFGQSD